MFREIFQSWPRFKSTGITGFEDDEPHISRIPKPHRCLEVPEIVALIISHVDDRPSFRTLSQVSRTLSDLAIDALYADLDSWFELFMCLPRSLWNLKPPPSPRMFSGGRFGKCGNGMRVWTLCFRRKMAEKEWTFLRSRAAKVRSIGFRHVPHSGVGRISSEGWNSLVYRRSQSIGPKSIMADQSVIDALVNAAPSVPVLFPNLCALALGHGCPAPALRMLLSPGLRKLHVSTGLLLDIANLTSPSAPDLCPFVESFHVQEELRFIRQNASARLICGWKHLRSIGGAVPIDQHVWKHLASLSSLDTLEIRAFSPPSRARAGICNKLREIDTLILSGGQYKDTISALEAVLGDRGPDTRFVVRRVDIRVLSSIASPDDSVVHLASALPELVYAETLRELRVASGRSLSPRDSDRPSVDDLLLPFVAFYGLTTVDLSTHLNGRSFTHPQLMDLACHWPSLEVLRLSSSQEAFSLQELLALGQVCPKIRIIDIPVMVSMANIREISTQMDSVRCLENATCLRLRGYPETKEDMEATVNVMGKLVPRLRHPNCEREDEEVAWNSVMGSMGKEPEVEKRELFRRYARAMCQCQ
ncbi:hypothetical protein CONPUDRAFT_165728 [Coniophora puteana RWD-64-598 SS2]|uniref:F-box domain-containing protein n=1 Tax=Coniophora puteana (strain RWD-64-598) TaxID=741705 RepID=A0A5M3MR37_CONPW|nr:uncharacterized protein CONPUDRAFT_165728 [Coniophora puteana RWD-64-598 SS2]EIW81643.1 hypothetical protein CONPUDRAFT_165728 [Coniophora puteana RWD-64-598 SS2]